MAAMEDFVEKWFLSRLRSWFRTRLEAEARLSVLTW
jgi:hypothetical protein